MGQKNLVISGTVITEGVINMTQVLVTLPNGQKVVKELKDITENSQENLFDTTLPGVHFTVYEK